MIIAKHFLLLSTVFFEVATLFCGAAKADAANTIDIAIVAHRTDQPHKPDGFVTVVILELSAFLVPKARRMIPTNPN